MASTFWIVEMLDHNPILFSKQPARKPCCYQGTSIDWFREIILVLCQISLPPPLLAHTFFWSPLPRSAGHTLPFILHPVCSHHRFGKLCTPSVSLLVSYGLLCFDVFPQKPASIWIEKEWPTFVWSWQCLYTAMVTNLTETTYVLGPNLLRVSQTSCIDFYRLWITSQILTFFLSPLLPY